jgi:hypothetical protein
MAIHIACLDWASQLGAGLSPGLFLVHRRGGMGTHENCTWLRAGHRLRNDGFCASYRGRGAHGGARSPIERRGVCDCPEDLKSNGRCGRGSSYCRCGGREPGCYPGDNVPTLKQNCAAATDCSSGPMSALGGSGRAAPEEEVRVWDP